MTTNNVKNTEAPEKMDKVELSLTDLKHLIKRLETVSEYCADSKIELSIKDGQLYVDYWYKPIVPAENIQIDFIILKDEQGVETEFNFSEVSMVSDPEPECEMGEIIDLDENPDMIIGTEPIVSELETTLLAELDEKLGDGAPEEVQQRRREVGALFTEFEEACKEAKNEIR